MSTSSRFPASTRILPLVLCAVGLAVGCHGRAGVSTPNGDMARLLVSAREADKPRDVGAARARVPFCLPGEKVVCTLGPPPVCHCE